VVGSTTSSEAGARCIRRDFDAHAEVGAAVCVYVDWSTVVDLWGGLADATTGREWEPDTVTLVYSSTKGVTSVSPTGSSNKAGSIPTPPSAFTGPSSGDGKEAITVAGAEPPGRLAVCGRRLHAQRSTGLGSDRHAAIATQAPIWPPGTQHGYHMRTFGWIVGRSSGASKAGRSAVLA